MKMSEHIKKSVLGSANSIDGCCALEHMTLLLIWGNFVACEFLSLILLLLLFSFILCSSFIAMDSFLLKHSLTEEHNFKTLTISFAFHLLFIRSVTKPIPFFIVSHSIRSILMGFYILIDFHLLAGCRRTFHVIIGSIQWINRKGIIMNRNLETIRCT